MSKIKLAIVYQVIFHYRIPFYQEIENDEDIDYVLFHGKGVKGTKLRNSTNSLKNKKQLFTLKLPFKLNGKKSYFSFFPFLFFSLIKSNPNVILLEGSSSIINNISAYLYAILFNKKIIYWSLGRVQGKKMSKARRHLDKLILFFENKSSAIFTYSTQGENYFLDRISNRKKIFKAINVVDTRPILNKGYQKVTNLKEFRLLFVGSVIEVKNLEVLIEAFIQLNKKYKNTYLDIIGSGQEYFQTLKNKYADNISNISFKGRIVEGLENYYLKSDIFVLPGLGGLAIAESMAYGVPVICSKADGTELDLIDKESGIIIENISVEKLNDKLTHLYSNRDLLEEMGAKARQRIERDFNFDNYYKQFKNSLKFAYEN